MKGRDSIVARSAIRAMLKGYDARTALQETLALYPAQVTDEGREEILRDIERGVSRKEWIPKQLRFSFEEKGPASG